jgi:hypothetical protein
MGSCRVSDGSRNRDIGSRLIGLAFGHARDGRRSDPELGCLRLRLLDSGVSLSYCRAEQEHQQHDVRLLVEASCSGRGTASMEPRR